ncbi:large subunit of carbamoyl phosphate synthase [Chloropicon primus]|uniref:Carbamoyl phosphate synthase arginine-specific large chain, chloroplastic n=1 Tax=Chloropicon primus TaxID=1764295 RepID=A0A5B8MNF9_9CHLO|nr:large subunit of carbamoyl phosphate synthase [Chloropicon primus]UPR01273.1 large subunit of carbamoyl phosphate synthase [Chloropicon primus]|eukprot:QDZ22053.1 large subunit of carbamoyl phosphate synthase [Chloropicon primus]
MKQAVVFSNKAAAAKQRTKKVLAGTEKRTLARNACVRAKAEYAGADRVLGRRDSVRARSAAAPEAPAFQEWSSRDGQKREDIKKIVILGAGPIVIGQACEFDYSGTQACKALKQEGYEIVLVNSNPATIMTDPGTADRTYVGPMTPESVKDILIKEKPDALLPTMGGQTALNLAKALAENGDLDELNIELIGAKLDAINVAEDRLLFKEAMDRIGLKTPPSGTAENMEEAHAIQKEIGNFPIIIRPAFTLGGTGGGIAYNMEEFNQIVQAGLTASMTSQVLIEKSLIGWKEYELEVMRDLKDNVVIICSIENIDPMGVHTGDSVTVAPAQTLTDKEYQRLRDASVAIIREVGVECGGSNVQFGVNPVDGEVMVIEMNPRVSRSSALASKATGFPIAKMAAKLAIGYTLDCIPNDITQKTPASFEPSIDYVVTKIPRFAFEKFPGSSPVLTTQMKSVGEAMAIGRTFQESFQKALRSLEVGLNGWSGPKGAATPTEEELRYNLRTPNPDRLVAVWYAMDAGFSTEEVIELTKMDPWFVNQLRCLKDVGEYVKASDLESLSASDWKQIKSRGFSDSQIAEFARVPEDVVRSLRRKCGVVPQMKRVDTCAAEFEANTPYMYSTYDGEDECGANNKSKVLILGGGPNRIGQGIEFDYCCCHAAFSLSAEGYETIMMNSNPETVSTDYDTSDRLYFEPLTVEDVVNVLEAERPEGIIVQFGGQTPLKLAKPLQKYLEENPIPAASGRGNVKIWGTSPDSIDAAEDREQFEALLKELNIDQPAGGIARSEGEAIEAANKLGYPVMVRPSYVLGGRAMEVVYNEKSLVKYINTAVAVDPEQPVLVDKYLSGATELDVDALADKDGNVVIGGIMEHIEEAGVHSGDSACALPTQSIPFDALTTIREWTPALAKSLGVVGLLNIQYAVHEGKPYIIEANPRASRTVPFVSKAIGSPLAKYASLLMAGKTLKELGFTQEPVLDHVAVKEAVLPFDKFPGTDTILGPEMRSTGEVMGIDASYANAYAKAQIAAGTKLPTSGTAYMSMTDATKQESVSVAKGLSQLGFKVVATKGTADFLKSNGVEVTSVLKLHEGRPHGIDMMQNDEIQLMIITPSGDEVDQKDGLVLRRKALAYKIPLVTTLPAAKAIVESIRAMQTKKLKMDALQDFF